MRKCLFILSFMVPLLFAGCKLIEVSPEAEGDRRTIETRLADQLRLKTNLRYNLEFHPPGSLPRYEVKARRFKDLRKKI